MDRYVNGFEQFILYARKEVDKDGELNSIEFSFYDTTPQITILVN